MWSATTPGTAEPTSLLLERLIEQNSGLFIGGEIGYHMLVAKAGVKPIRLHDARHSHASLMLKQGIHPKIVQERLGHSSIQMTLDTYSHVAPGLQQAAADSFDKLLNGKSENVAVENHY